MFHLWTLIPALYVSFRFVFLLSLPLQVKALIAVVLVLCAEYHLISKLLFGNMFSPEFPHPLMIFLGWMFGSIVVFALLLVVRDLFFAVAWLFTRANRSTLPVGYVLMILSLAVSGYGVWQSVKVPAVKEVAVTLPGLPAAFEGYRIAQLTDLHISRLLTTGWLKRVVDKTNQQHADLVAVTGDMADGNVEDRLPDMKPLALLNAKDGVFAVTGNHEYYFQGENWIAAYSELGLHFLNNEHVAISRNGEDLIVAGITDKVAGNYGGQPPDLEKALSGVSQHEKVVLLSHRPDNARQTAAAGVSLQLSGHTHGGMMAGLDKVVARANDGFVSGLYAVGNMALYVSNGTGLWNGFPIRLGKPSEITIFTLHAGK